MLWLLGVPIDHVMTGDKAEVNESSDLKRPFRKLIFVRMTTSMNTATRLLSPIIFSLTENHIAPL